MTNEKKKLPDMRKPGDGKLKTQPPKKVRNHNPFGDLPTNPNADLTDLTPDEQDLIMDLSQTGGFEGVAEAYRIIRAERDAAAQEDEEGRRSSRVKQGTPITYAEDALPKRSNSRYITVEREVEKYITEHHFIQKLSGVAAGFIAGSVITLILGAIVFNQLLSEGYIRQYFY